MAEKSKSKEIDHKSLSGMKVVAQIFGYGTQHVSDVVNGRRPDKKGILKELEQYAQFQKAYIKKRQIILGFNKK